MSCGRTPLAVYEPENVPRSLPAHTSYTVAEHGASTVAPPHSPTSAKAMVMSAGAGGVALLNWLAKHAEACDVGDALASPLITRLYDKARAPKDAAIECVTALVRKGALDRSSLENALDAAPIVGRRVVAQLLEGVFREASPIKVV